MSVQAFTLYNAGVRAAVRAYRADRLHDEGICTLCERRRTGEASRVCQACRKEKTRRAGE